MRQTGWYPAAVCIALALCGGAAAQESRLPLPSDERRTIVSQADAAAAAGKFADAVERWQSAIDMPEDFFDPAAPRQSLHARAEEKLLGSGPAALAAYENRFGAQAKALLNDALRDDDPQRLIEVVRRYFGTAAGHAAAAVAAERLADEGNALAAARLYDRLTRHPLSSPVQRTEWLMRAGVCWWLAGFEESARERFARHQEEASRAGETAAATVARQQAGQAWLSRLQAGAEPADSAALRETAAFRGDPQRNGHYAAAVPVGDAAWSAAVVDREDSLDRYESGEQPRTDEVLRRMRRLAESNLEKDADRLLFPAGVPVTAGGLVVYRGPASVKAVSLETGEQAWSCAHIDDTFHHLLDQEWSRRSEEWYSPNVDLLLTQRMWRDASATSLSTDGAQVYAIADGGMVSPIVQSAVSLPALSEHPLAPHSNNRLLAIELRTGRLKWVLGGPVSDEPLSGAFFLGAPLLLDGQLYCLVEIQGQLQLVVLNPGGTVVWTQPLYNPNGNLTNPAAGTARRMAGLSPAAAGDIVICPTGETTVVAVDRLRRTLLWTFEYQRPANESPQTALMMRMAMARQQLRARVEDQLNDDLQRTDHWQDAAPVIAEQSVLLTLPDSQDLICVSLLEGREVWRQPRGRRQMIAAVHRGRVIVIGQETVEALRLADGEPAWEAPLPIPGPAGRGVRHGEWYVLPLATGDVATINLESGRMLARTTLPTECRRGNLVAAEARIICQTVTGVHAFRSLRELSERTEAQLAVNPDDAASLLRRGELRLHLGDEPGGLSDLRRAVEIDPESPARKLLAGTLIEGLRTDFDTYREVAPEIESLTRAATEQAQFHRLFAAGLQRRGEIEAAFRQYLKFAENVAGFSALQKIEGARQVRGDLWIAGRLEELLESVEGEKRERLSQELVRTVDAALSSNDQPRLLALRRIVPDRPERDRIDLHLMQDGQLPDAELESLLIGLLESTEPSVAAAATARLADRWLQAGVDSDFLDRLLDDLKGPLSAVPCRDGRTGGELVAAWRGDPARAALIDRPDPWPTAQVSAHEQSQNMPAPAVPVRHLGRRSEVLAGWSFFTDPPGSRLFAYDRHGRLAWQAPTGTTTLRGKRGVNYVRYVATRGRHVLLVVEDQWQLIDALSGAKDSQLVVAGESLISENTGTGMIFNAPRMNQPGRNRNRAWIDPNSGIAVFGNVGPLVNDMFVYQSGTRFTAVNAATGAPLWTHDRPDLQPGGDIVSDGRVVVVWPPDSPELHLFRATDGTALDPVPLPRHVSLPQPEGHWGARLVTLDRGFDGRKFTLGLFDPVENATTWRLEAEGVVDWGVIDGRDFYILGGNQALTIVDGDTGEVRWRHSFPAGTDAELATVWSDAERWYAATYRTPTDGRELIEVPYSQQPLVHGSIVAASRTTGEVQWSVPVEFQRLQRDVPGAWPFLVLSSQVSTPARAENGRSASRESTLLLLMKASGRVLFESTVSGAADRQGWISDPAEHRIRLGLGAGTVLLQFGEAGDQAAEEPDQPTAPPQY